jgi:hypothetical protein
VAVEKVGFPVKSRKLGDRKCPGDWEKSIVELPDAIQFLQILSERVFQQPQALSLAVSIRDWWWEADLLAVIRAVRRTNPTHEPITSSLRVIQNE